MKNNNSVLIIDLTSTTPVYTAYFSNALKNEGFIVDIAGIERKEETKYIKHLYFNYISWMDFSNKINFLFFKNIVKIIEYLINWLMVLIIAPKYLVVHIQWLPLSKYNSLDIFFAKILLRRNNKLFYTVHNILPHGNYSKKTRNRFKRIYDFMPNLVVHTEKTKEELIEHFNVLENKIIIMPHGPLFGDLSSNKIKRDKNLIGMIGSIKPYKGIEDAFEMLKKIIDNGYKIKLVLAGSGPENYIRKLENMIKKMDLNNNVIRTYRYLSIKKMVDKYESVCAIIAPYKKIDQSGAVITALSLGTPVIGYKIGGLKDLIIDEYNGRLVDYGNIYQLVEGVEWVLNQDSTRIYNNCINSLQRYSWGKAAKIMARYYIGN